MIDKTKTTEIKRKADLASDQLELLFNRYKIAARIWGGTVGPNIVRMVLTVSPTVRFQKIESLAPEIAACLGVNDVIIRRERDAITIEVPYHTDTPAVGEVWESKDWRTIWRDGIVTFVGLDSDGVARGVRLDSPVTPHALIAGTTGSGKTTLLSTMIWWLIQMYTPGKLQLAILDPKNGSHFKRFENDNHLLGTIATGSEIGLDALQKLEAFMDKRYSLGIKRPHVVIAIDEIADLIILGGAAAETSLLRLVQKGREAGITVIGATQKPSALTLPTGAKFNMPLRLVGSVASPEDAKAASGVKDTGAEKLPGRGAFLQVLAGSPTVRLQALKIDG